MCIGNIFKKITPYIFAVILGEDAMTNDICRNGMFWGTTNLILDFVIINKYKIKIIYRYKNSIKFNNKLIINNLNLFIILLKLNYIFIHHNLHT